MRGNGGRGKCAAGVAPVFARAKRPRTPTVDLGKKNGALREQGSIGISR